MYYRTDQIVVAISKSHFCVSAFVIRTGVFSMSSFYKFVDTKSQRVNLKKCTFSRRHLDDRLLDEWATPAAAAPGWLSSNDEQVHSIILSLDAHVNNKRRKRCIWSVMLWLFCTGCVGRSRCLYTLQGGCAAVRSLLTRTETDNKSTFFSSPHPNPRPSQILLCMWQKAAGEEFQSTWAFLLLSLAVV
jgi:hypothetical protein